MGLMFIWDRSVIWGSRRANILGNEETYVVYPLRRRFYDQGNRSIRLYRAFVRTRNESRQHKSPADAIRFAQPSGRLDIVTSEVIVDFLIGK